MIFNWYTLSALLVALASASSSLVTSSSATSLHVSSSHAVKKSKKLDANLFSLLNQELDKSPSSTNKIQHSSSSSSSHLKVRETSTWITAKLSFNNDPTTPEEFHGQKTGVCVPDPAHGLLGAVYGCSKIEDSSNIALMKTLYSSADCAEGTSTDTKSIIMTPEIAQLYGISFDCADFESPPYEGVGNGYLQLYYVTQSCSSEAVRFSMNYPGCREQGVYNGQSYSSYYWCESDMLHKKTYAGDDCSLNYCNYQTMGMESCTQTENDYNPDEEDDDVLPSNDYPLYVTATCTHNDAPVDSGSAEETCYFNDGGNNDNDGGNNWNVAELIEGSHFGYCVQTAYSNKDGTKAHCLAQDNINQRNVLSYTYTAQFKNGKYRYETGVGAGVENDHLRTFANERTNWVDYTVEADQYGGACIRTSDGSTFHVDFYSGMYHESGQYFTKSNTATNDCGFDDRLHCSEDYMYGYDCRAMGYKGKGGNTVNSAP